MSDVVYIEGDRQTGKSTKLMAIALKDAINNPCKRCIIVTPYLTRGGLDNLLRNAILNVRLTASIVRKDFVLFDNGASLEIVNGKNFFALEHSLRGSTGFVYIDDANYVDYREAFLQYFSREQLLSGNFGLKELFEKAFSHYEVRAIVLLKAGEQIEPTASRRN